jgi:hypothetical protein
MHHRRGSAVAGRRGGGGRGNRHEPRRPPVTKPARRLRSPERPGGGGPDGREAAVQQQESHSQRRSIAGHSARVRRVRRVAALDCVAGWYRSSSSGVERIECEEKREVYRGYGRRTSLSAMWCVAHGRGHLCGAEGCWFWRVKHTASFLTEEARQ